MVMAYSALANSGKLVVPKIVDKIVDCDGKGSEIETREVGQVVSPETASKISLMLESVVVNGHGKRAAVAGFRVGGKTGTAQVPKADGSGYEENIHIGSFVGFAPIEDPKFVMLVRLNNPKGVEFAESSAAPLFGQIANYLLNYYYKLPVK
jgi:cell division protein FtsI/penicillin-binding protein 2